MSEVVFGLKWSQNEVSLYLHSNAERNTKHAMCSGELRNDVLFLGTWN